MLLFAVYIHGVARLALRRWGKLERSGRGVLLLAFALVMLAFLIARLVRLAGQLANLLVWLAGIGGLVMALVGRYRAAPGPVSC